MVRFLVTFILFLVTFFPSPVYAFHCENPQYQRYQIGGRFCSDEYPGDERIFEDLNNCTSDPNPENHHRLVGQCGASEVCVPDNAGDYSVYRTVRCVSKTAAGGTSASTPTSCGSGTDPAGLTQIECVFTNVISVVVGLGFIVLLVMLVWAGFKYLTSGGEPKAVQATHQTVSWALLGILFMAVAWLVLQLIHGFTGIDVTKFKVGLP